MILRSHVHVIAGQIDERCRPTISCRFKIKFTKNSFSNIIYVFVCLIAYNILVLLLLFRFSQNFSIASGRIDICL